MKKVNRPKAKTKKEKPLTIVAIGASVGGLKAVSALFKHLTSDTEMVFIYVQHLSPDHKSGITQLLSRVTKMKVQEVTDMVLMKANHIYVIPHNKGIAVRNGHISLLPRSKNALEGAIDVLFSSLARTHGKHV